MQQFIVCQLSLNLLNVVFILLKEDFFFLMSGVCFFLPSQQMTSSPWNFSNFSLKFCPVHLSWKRIQISLCKSNLVAKVLSISSQALIIECRDRKVKHISSRRKSKEGKQNNMAENLLHYSVCKPDCWRGSESSPRCVTVKQKLLCNDSVLLEW